MLPPPDPGNRLDLSSLVQSNRRMLAGPVLITVASLIGVGLMNDADPASGSAHHFSLLAHPDAPSQGRLKLASAPLIKADRPQVEVPVVTVAVPTQESDGIRARADRVVATVTSAPSVPATPAATQRPSSATTVRAASSHPTGTTPPKSVPTPPTKPTVSNNPTTTSGPPTTGYGVSYVTAGPGGTCVDPHFPVKGVHNAYFLPSSAGYATTPATQCYASGSVATQAGLSVGTYDPPKPVI